MICPLFVARHEGEAEMRESNVHLGAHLFS